MTSTPAHRFKKVGITLAAFGAAAVATAPAAHATAYFGSLHAYEGSQEVAESSGGSIYYEGTGNGRTITENIRFRDVRADGDGAYGVAVQQAWDKITAPRCCTYYTWAWTNEDQTDRYGTAYGWRTSYLRESDANVSRWRVNAKVCEDQNNEPDACDSAGYLEP